MSERWLPVVGYEDYYEVSDRGRVRGVDRVVPNRTAGAGGMRVKGRLLKPKIARPEDGGHAFAALTRSGVTIRVGIHVLVLEAFVGPRPDGLEGCHNDGNPENNFVENLRWDTHQNNMLDTLEHGTNWQMQRTHCPQGHEYTPENTYLAPGSRNRQCRICKLETSRRSKARKREALGKRPRVLKTHCPQGHPYSEENTYVTKVGKRNCRACQRARQNKAKHLDRRGNRE